MNLSLAIAREKPVGVVIAAWSGRLSRMYHWDVERDELTPGQFIKARASVLAISPDGKYVVYNAVAFSKREQAYVAISHLPYFTAHAFFLQFHLGICCAKFISSSLLELGTNTGGYGWVEGRDRIQDRIDPGCPFEIKRLKTLKLYYHQVAALFGDPALVEDPARSRQVRAE